MVALGCYVPIALVGASRLIPLFGDQPVRVGAIVSQYAGEQRYQYLPPALLAAALAIVVAAAADRRPRTGLVTEVGLLGWLALAGPLYWQTRAALERPDPGDPLAAVMRQVRAKAADVPVGGDVWLRNQPWLFWHDATFPGTLAFFVIASPEDVVDGRHIHFVDEDAGLVRVVQAERSRASRLLMAHKGSAADCATCRRAWVT